MRISINISLVVVCFIVYAAILSLYDTTQVIAFKYAANGLAFISIVFAWWHGIRRASTRYSRETLISTFLALITALNYFISMDQPLAADAFKITGAIGFFLFGIAIYRNEGSCSIKKSTAIIFSLFPILLFIAKALFSGTAISESSTEMLVNRNNAIFFVVVSALVLRLAGFSTLNLLIYLVTASLFFKTLGAILSLGIAAFVTFLNPKQRIKGIVYLAIALPVTYFAGSLTGAFDRVYTVIDGVRAINSVYGITMISDISYGDIVQTAGTTDISALFRIKHWIELIEAFLAGGIPAMMIGIGVGRSVILGQHALLPHNDYIRIFIEFGILYFVLFMQILRRCFKGLNIEIYRLVAIFLAIYMASENLINNFTAMSVFFCVAGLLYAKTTQPEKQGRQDTYI